MADVFITGITDVDNMVVSPGSFDVVSGTGNFTPFLRVDDSDGTSEGFNTDDSGKVLDNGASWTQSLKLSEVPIVIRNGVAYYEIRLDLNEPNNGTDGLGRPASQVGLSEFQVYFSDRGATLGDYTGSSTTALGSAFTKVYDLDSGTDRTLVLSDGASGSGRDDYVFYIPVANFSAAEADDYFTLYAKFGPSPEENATFEEFRIRRDTGTITGTKFADINGDGIKQASEGTLSGFKFYIDVNGNDQFDAGEIYAVSGANGSFTFQSLTAGTYTIREDMTAEQKALYTSITGAQSGGEITVTVTASGTTTIFWGNQPKIADFSLTKTVTSIDGGTKVGANWVADSAGDVVNYSIVITNTGNIALTGKSIVDANGVLGAISGDTNSNGVLDVGETWTVTATHAVSQAELDSKGTSDTGALDSDGDTDNKVVVDFAETEAKSASAVSLLTYNPNFSVVKTVTSITGGTKVGSDYFADSAGDVVNYDIVITNTGNITLTGKSILDANGVIGAISGDTDGDGNLDVGEAWTIKATHAVSQAELDSKGTSNTAALDSDGDTDNLVSVKFAETGTKTGEAVSYLVYNPDFSVVKSVASITGGVTIGGIT
ncbi:DUF7507 domain-containing protein, partial [Sphingomonas rosea]|uniref:DUF7507 domain-containing protein n=1 Tax=Sphingomonas rosea TaxID=335605 RepID=UPI0031D66460